MLLWTVSFPPNWVLYWISCITRFKWGTGMGTVECIHCDGTGTCKKAVRELKGRAFRYHCDMCGWGVGEVYDQRPPTCRVCGGKGFIEGADDYEEYDDDDDYYEPEDRELSPEELVIALHKLDEPGQRRFLSLLDPSMFLGVLYELDEPDQVSFLSCFDPSFLACSLLVKYNSLEEAETVLRNSAEDLGYGALRGMEAVLGRAADEGNAVKHSEVENNGMQAGSQSRQAAESTKIGPNSDSSGYESTSQRCVDGQASAESVASSKVKKGTTIAEKKVALEKCPHCKGTGICMGIGRDDPRCKTCGGTGKISTGKKTTAKKATAKTISARRATGKGATGEKATAKFEFRTFLARNWYR